MGFRPKIVLKKSIASTFLRFCLTCKLVTTFISLEIRNSYFQEIRLSKLAPKRKLNIRKTFRGTPMLKCTFNKAACA